MNHGPPRSVPNGPGTAARPYLPPGQAATPQQHSCAHLSQPKPACSADPRIQGAVEQSAVRILDDGTRRSRPEQGSRADWLIGGVLIVLLFGLLIGYPVSHSSDRPLSESVADSSAEPPEAQGWSAAIFPLDARIPRLAGSLVATVGVGDFELLIWPADRTAPESVNIGDAVSPAGPYAPPVTWDASGSAYAFLRNLDGGETVLYVGSDAGYLPLARRVKWLAWHATEPGRLAWTVAGADGVEQQLFVAEIAGSASSEPVLSATLPAIERLLGWDEAGFVLGFQDEEPGGEWTRRIDDTGREIGRARATLVAMRGDGRLLLTTRTGRSSSFYRVDQEWGALTALELAPAEASGRVKPAAWAPDGRIAFIALHPNSNLWRLEVLEPDGGAPVVQELPGQVWDVGWSPDGRFVVMPGFDSRGGRGHLVFAYDSLEATLYEIEFDARVAGVLIRR